jgi:hypothetical protein
MFNNINGDKTNKQRHFYDGIKRINDQRIPCSLKLLLSQNTKNYKICETSLPFLLNGHEICLKQRKHKLQVLKTQYSGKYFHTRGVKKQGSLGCYVVLSVEETIMGLMYNLKEGYKK